MRYQARSGEANGSEPAVPFSAGLLAGDRGEDSCSGLRRDTRREPSEPGSATCGSWPYLLPPSPSGWKAPTQAQAQEEKESKLSEEKP